MTLEQIATDEITQARADSEKKGSFFDILLKSKSLQNPRIAFAAAILSGFICHIYALTNNLVNSDSIQTDTSSGAALTSGRWLINIVGKISSEFMLPVVNGVLSILFLALAAAVIVKFLDIRSKTNIILASCLIMTFPSVAATLVYGFTADIYMLAVLLTVSAALVTQKFKLGCIAGAVLLCCSLAIYQAYLSVYIVLVLIIFVKMLLDREIKVKKVFAESVRYLCCLFGGLALYYITLQVSLAFEGEELSNYQGISEAGISLENIINGFICSFKDFIFIPIKASGGKNYFLGRTIIASLILGFVVLVILIIKNKIYRQPVKLVILTALLLCFPCASTYVYFISTQTLYHILMRFSLVLYFISVLCMCEKYMESDSENSKKEFLYKNTVRGISVVLCFINIFGFFIISNLGYACVERRYEKTYANELRLVLDIMSNEEFTDDMPVVICGDFDTYEDDFLKKARPHIFEMTGMANELVKEDAHHKAFISKYIGVDFDSTDNDTVQRLFLKQEVIDMKCWPDESSIIIVDGVMIVRVG